MFFCWPSPTHLPFYSPLPPGGFTTCLFLAGSSWEGKLKKSQITKMYRTPGTGVDNPAGKDELISKSILFSTFRQWRFCTFQFISSREEYRQAWWSTKRPISPFISFFFDSCSSFQFEHHFLFFPLPSFPCSCWSTQKALLFLDSIKNNYDSRGQKKNKKRCTNACSSKRP